MFLNGNDVTNSASTTTDALDQSGAFDEGPEIELGGIAMEILDVDLRGHKVGGILRKTKVGKGGKILGRDELVVRSALFEASGQESLTSASS